MKDLDAAAVRRLLSRWDYAPEAVEAYGRAMERAMRNAGAHEALERAVDGYEAGGDMDIRALLAQMDGFAAPCGESPYTMRMLPYIAMLDGAAARYGSAGIGEKVYHDSFADLLWKTRECHRVYGVWGSFVAPWFYRFFELKCFALGRLQFEFTSFNADGPLESARRPLSATPGYCTRSAGHCRRIPAYGALPPTMSCCASSTTGNARTCGSFSAAPGTATPPRCRRIRRCGAFSSAGCWKAAALDADTGCICAQNRR